MINIKRPIPYVLISSNHGTMIVNRNDWKMINDKEAIGVGNQLLNLSSFDQDEIDFAIALINKRRLHYGDGVLAIDCGANIGVHTVEWARFMYGWGSVISFEPQEKVYYALAGNIAINNCFNVSAKNCAVGSKCGSISIPNINYYVPSSYGSLELIEKSNNEFIGQSVDYSNYYDVPLVSIDSLNLKRIDFLKIDVEGMENEVLIGSQESIDKFKPIIIIENLKSDAFELNKKLNIMGYTLNQIWGNVLAIHKSDPTYNHLIVNSEGIFIK